MKSFETIASQANPKDYYVVAEIANCSTKNVQLVVRGKRGDHYNIQKIFSDFLTMQEHFYKDIKTLLKQKYRLERGKE